jgi:hypothetical protein
MNKRLFCFTVFFSLIFSGCAEKSSHQTPVTKNSGVGGPKIAFQATYDFSTPKLNYQQHVYADGNGHLRMEALEPVTQKNLVSLIDYQKQTIFTIVDNHKVVLMAPLRDDDAHPIVDDVTAALHKATNLGSETIDGHPCQGWQYLTGNIVTTLWLGKDTGWIVDSQSAAQNGILKLHLLSYKAGNQDPALFALPKDYRVMEADMAPSR